MGGKDSKVAGSPLTAYYESTLRESLLGDIKAKLKDKFNVSLQPATADGTGPVLDIRDGTKDDMFKLQEKSEGFESDRLMVVMVNEINKDPGLDSTRMVQLKWSLDFAGKTEKSTVRKIITDFIKPREQEETANSEQTQAVDATGRRPQTEKTKPTTSPKAFSNDAIRDPPDCLLREVGKRSDDLGATAGATSSATVPFAYGRDKDWLLQDAVKFVEEHCGVPLSEAGNISAESPLLVFCKEETGLVPDVRGAIGKTRKGADVMLLVVTDKRDLPLDELDKCDSTTGFGAKDCLLWDPCRKKFGTKENCDALLWIQQFLENFSFEMNMKLSRTSSVRRSFKALGVKPISGVYYLAQPAKEQEEKAAVLFLNDQLIKLRKTDDSHASPVIVFCVVGDTLDDVIDKWTTKRQESQEAFLVVLYRSYHTDRLQHLPSSVSKLRLSEDGREVASIADNSKVPASVRNFLAKARRHKNSFGQQQEEPASREEQQVRQQDDGNSLSGVGCFRH